MFCVQLVLSVVCSSDVAYYDGLSETILSVALVKPKPGWRAQTTSLYADVLF